LALRPRLLLLDEPLGALDRRLREDTQIALKDLQARLGTTFVMVTHDQSEAMTMADRIAVMQGGRIVQVACPRELYQRPATRFVAGFVGEVNLIEGRIIGRDPVHRRIETALGMFVVAADEDFAPGEAVTVAVRPERCRSPRLAG
jgi:putrescine transport system ATP-binding protein